jgi:hypothetical protein
MGANESTNKGATTVAPVSGTTGASKVATTGALALTFYQGKESNGKFYEQYNTNNVPDNCVGNSLFCNATIFSDNKYCYTGALCKEYNYKEACLPDGFKVSENLCASHSHSCQPQYKCAKVKDICPAKSALSSYELNREETAALYDKARSTKSYDFKGAINCYYDKNALTSNPSELIELYDSLNAPSSAPGNKEKLFNSSIMKTFCSGSTVNKCGIDPITGKQRGTCSRFLYLD